MDEKLSFTLTIVSHTSLQPRFIPFRIKTDTLSTSPRRATALSSAHRKRLGFNAKWNY
jgi:hypothetical protein